MIADEALLPRARLDADATARACCSVAAFEQTSTACYQHTQQALAAPGARPGIVYDTDNRLALDLYLRDLPCQAGNRRALLWRPSRLPDGGCVVLGRLCPGA